MREKDGNNVLRKPNIFGLLANKNKKKKKEERANLLFCPFRFVASS